MVPAAGLIDQVTAVFDAPVTVAENCLVCDGVNVTEAGETETPIVGLNVMAAVAFFDGSPTLVAVRTTVWVAVIDAGAV